MSEVIHAFDYLARPQDHPPQAITVVFGDAWLLQKLALEKIRASVFGDEPIPYETFDGVDADWRDVHDELLTVSLFGAGRPRLVVVVDADKFISENRSHLEAHAENPAGRGLLVLITNTFAANTRLYKKVQTAHLAIECRAPELRRGKNKAIDEKRLVRWLCENAKTRHAAQLSTSAAELLLDLVGPDFGRLDNETEKLAIHVGANGKITPDLVRELVGGWRSKTIWELIDAALEGDSALALSQLNQLIQAGEEPVALFAQMAWAMRQLAAATRFYEQKEQQGQKVSARDALSAAGVHWNKLEKAERQLKQLGRARAGQLYRWLMDTDMALKGSHSSKPRGRWALEQLILRVGAPPAQRMR